jgi:hypothetical protein
MADDVFEEPWFGLQYHAKTRTLLALGHTHFVQDAYASSPQHKNECHYSSPDLKSSIVYSVWDAEKREFGLWSRMIIPEPLDLGIYYNGQTHQRADGTILIPGYYFGPLRDGQQAAHVRVTVLRCEFDGSDLRYIEHGNVLQVETERGLAEPSLVYLDGRYFMTVRHNHRGYVATSEDGLHFDGLTPWRFDDGEDLGNYNTQQHWLKHGDALYLVYNRKSDLNNGVFRSRAPLYMAEIDTEQLRVRRTTERIVFPENGARMGNFCMADVSACESWIVSGEWVQGTFGHSTKGTRFWVNSENFKEPYNYIQYIGNLLLARTFWNDQSNLTRGK